MTTESYYTSPDAAPLPEEDQSTMSYDTDPEQTIGLGVRLPGCTLDGPPRLPTPILKIMPISHEAPLENPAALRESASRDQI